MGNIQKIVIYGGLAVLGIFLISGTEAKGNSPANDDWETYKVIFLYIRNNKF